VKTVSNSNAQPAGATRTSHGTIDVNCKHKHCENSNSEHDMRRLCSTSRNEAQTASGDELIGAVADPRRIKPLRCASSPPCKNGMGVLGACGLWRRRFKWVHDAEKTFRFRACVELLSEGKLARSAAQRKIKPANTAPSSLLHRPNREGRRCCRRGEYYHERLKESPDALAISRQTRHRQRQSHRAVSNRV